MKKIPVTLIIPVKNEERNLSHCLSLVQDFDQVMVVDSNSTDRTGDVAEKFGVELYQFFWNGKFPKKRNWALRSLPIRNEWVLFLDADEFLTEEFKKELVHKIKDPAISGFWITYSKFFMGRQLRFGEKLKKLALFKVGKGEYEKVDEDAWSHLDMEVHEHTLVQGKTGQLKNYVLHNDFKNLDHYIYKHNAYSTWEANRFFYIKRNGFRNLNLKQVVKYRLLQVGLLPTLDFIGNYFLKLGFLDGIQGFYFAQYRAFYFYQIQSKIIELQNNKQRTVPKEEQVSIRLN